MTIKMRIIKRNLKYIYTRIHAEWKIKIKTITQIKRATTSKKNKKKVATYLCRGIHVASLECIYKYKRERWRLSAITFTMRYFISKNKILLFFHLYSYFCRKKMLFLFFAILVEKIVILNQEEWSFQENYNFINIIHTHINPKAFQKICKIFSFSFEVFVCIVSSLIRSAYMSR